MTSKVRCKIHGVSDGSLLREPWHILTAPKGIYFDVSVPKHRMIRRGVRNVQWTFRPS